MCECGLVVEPPVYRLDHKPLNRKEFEKWVLASIFSELDKFVTTDDKFLVAVSGGKDSTLLLDAVQQWTTLKNRNSPEALIIDEGVKNMSYSIWKLGESIPVFGRIFANRLSSRRQEDRGLFAPQKSGCSSI